MTPETVLHDLAALSLVAHFDYVAVLGGEPMLHSDLAWIVNVVKASYVADHVRVVTNGWMIPQMTDDFWESMRFETLEWTLYPNLNEQHENEIRRVLDDKCREFSVSLISNRKSEFTYCFDRPDDGQRFRDCQWKGSCVTVHEGFLYLCAQSRVFPKLFMGGLQGCDGIALEGLTEPKLREFMERKEPLASCSICAGSQGATHPHEQVREGWKERSTAP